MSWIKVITCDICGGNIPTDQDEFTTSGSNETAMVADEGTIVAGGLVGTNHSPENVHAYIAYESTIDVCKACCKLIMK